MRFAAISLSKNIARMRNEIGRGGVYGATATIFMEGNPISRKKNCVLAFFSCAQRARLKNVGGGCGGGKVPPSTRLSKILF